MKQTIIDEFFTPNSVLVCFTDGSALENGSENCRGGFAVVWPHHSKFDYKQHLCPCTNNRAEYSAVIHAIKTADLIDQEYKKTLIVYTDSMLIVNSMTLWLSGWKKRDYVKSDGKPVLNVDLIKTIDEMMQKRRVVFRHVKAHTNSDDWQSIHNARADKMAREAALS